MARPTKDGLDYFPIDLDIMDEDSVAFVDAKYGVQAFGLLVRLLMRIYRNGYYMMWSEREQYLFAKDINVNIDETQTIVNEYINGGFFNKNLYKEYGILTSRGIQKRYLKACERRKKLPIIKEFFLINDDDEIKTVNVTFTSVYDDINCDKFNLTSAKTPQSKVKKSKEKESKEYIRAHECDRAVNCVDNFSDQEHENRFRQSNDIYPTGNVAEETAATVKADSLESFEPTPEFEKFWNAYPRTARSSVNKTFEAWRAVVNQGISPNDLWMAANKYAMQLKAEGTKEQFYQAAQNFFIKGTYRGYLPVKPVQVNCGGCKYYHLCKGNGYFTFDERDEKTGKIYEQTQICPYKGVETA